VRLFPERADRGTRWLLAMALVLSLLVHAGGAGVARWWWPQIARAVDRVFPHAAPTPEIVALTDTIRIEKRTVPRPSRRAKEQHRAHAQPQRPQPRPIARLPLAERVAVPTLPPVATPEPTAAPVTKLKPHEHGTIHRVVAMTQPRERPTSAPSSPSSPRTTFAQQVEAYQSQWSRTIADAQRSLTDVPPPPRPAARMPEQPRYDAIMSGSPEKFLTAQGVCKPLEKYAHGPVVFRYLNCDIQYSDGHFENVSIPWPFHWSAKADPFADYDRGISGRHPFPMQGPPDGYDLPHPFALSRAVCSFFRTRCAAVIAGEEANGGNPATNP